MGDITEEIEDRMIALAKHIKELRGERAVLDEQVALWEERLRALKLMLEMEEDTVGPQRSRKEGQGVRVRCG